LPLTALLAVLAALGAAARLSLRDAGERERERADQQNRPPHDLSFPAAARSPKLR
jgi:hypothetical protein